MASENREEILEYYKGELSYLRKMGAEFARQYPKVAGRLELSIDQSPDPHVERLIEAFAFLTARIQHKADSEFSNISSALLSTLYPQFLSPIPSMTIARFEIDPQHGGFTTAHEIPKHTPLFAVSDSKGGEDTICRFRTCYPVTLLPISVESAGFEPKENFDFLMSGKKRALKNIASVIRIRIKTHNRPFTEMKVDKLRFYLNGERVMINSLYEYLFCHTRGIVIRPDNGLPEKEIFLPENTIAPVGFAPDEDVLPYPANAHSGYRLIHEYFTFPGKFNFFDLNNLDCHKAQKYFDILILSDQMPGKRVSVNADTFYMGCVPIINLFRKTTDPIRLDERHTAYPLFPDKRREKITEIHSIESVSASNDPTDKSVSVAPFFSFKHHTEQEENKAFWCAYREPSSRKSLPGTQMFISFVNLNYAPDRPPHTTVYAHTLCTNRKFADELPEGAILQAEWEAPVARIVTLSRPTPQLDPPMSGQTLWRLISHLSLNYLSLGNDPDSLTALQEILKLYSFSDRSSTHQQIAGIEKMSCRQIMRRVDKDIWKGFCRGTEITLEFNEGMYEGNSAFLLGAVLNSFFSLYVSVNSFTQLVIKRRHQEGVWKKWQPMVGQQIVL